MPRPEPARAALAEAIATLRSAGVASPRVDAELLLTHVLGTTRSRLVLIDELDPGSVSRFGELIARRAAREPLQHLLGTAPFRHLELRVGPGVFVPRPETELLVDAVLAGLPDGAIVVDLCAGSGALALAVAQEAPGSVVFAVERSPAALTWLRGNAAGSTVRVVAADVREPDLLAELTGRVHAVLSNPPYVPDGTAVGAEVTHDPGEAVFAGPDGLGLMPAVVAAAARLLRPGGRLAVEHDDSHGRSVPDLLRAAGGWAEVADHADLAGRPRYATALRSRS